MSGYRIVKAPGGSTKACPQCGNDRLARLFSLNLKACTDCGIYIRWELDDGQKPLL